MDGDFSADADLDKRMNLETTTLDPSFLRAVVLMTGFKPSPMRNAQAALLAIGLRMEEFTAADLPGEVTAGSSITPKWSSGKTRSPPCSALKRSDYCTSN